MLLTLRYIRYVAAAHSYRPPGVGNPHLASGGLPAGSYSLLYVSCNTGFHRLRSIHGPGDDFSELCRAYGPYLTLETLEYLGAIGKLTKKEDGWDAERISIPFDE
ncbi:Protein of unknown function [Pyronema omphalodes CBS 100304]|uniref:Uncharacterized protein n=1 Tax=Pyronema omphalodes (strain CBS 100304) TaxID=1076935 RepID=U4LQR4_PYROM|nr:Protein of unknown function [Pyronema omphalodes CBS 100304]